MKKSIIERKNAKRVVALLESNPTLDIRGVAKSLKIWYNVAGFLVEGLRKEGYIKTAPNIKTAISLIHSSQPGILRKAFKAGKVRNTELIKMTEKAGGDLNTLRRDVNALIKSNAITREKENGRVVYKTTIAA